MKLIDRFESKIYYGLDGCWYWTGALSKLGYAKINVNKINRNASRVSFELFKGEIGDLFVCHTCDNRCCVNPDHLFLGTQSDNMQDMHRKRRGYYKGWPKFSKAMIIEIKSLLGKLKQREIAEQFGVSKSYVSALNMGIVWKNL